MNNLLGRKYSNKMYFIGIVILLALCPLYTAAVCQDSNCLVCNDISVCNVCHDGYYLEAGSCLQCPTNCATCTNSTQCQTCLDKDWNPLQQCSGVCTSGCTDAGCNDTTGYCYECISGRYGANCYISCSHCVEGDCDRFGCTKGCNKGYVQYFSYLKGDTGYYRSGYKECLPCPSNCALCSNTTYCTQCDQGYYGSYYRYPTSGIGTRNCVQCDDQCTECTSIDQCPEWCQPECIQQGCGVSGNCSTTTPTPTTIKLTSTSKEDISTTIKSQENTPPATTKTTVCPTECTSGCDTQGVCHETTTIESDGPSAASQDMEYYEGFGHGVATGFGVVIFIAALIGITCFLIRRTQCIKTPCFANTTTTSKEQHVYYNTQTESDRTSSNPSNTPDYVNADIVTPVQDSEYEINETGEYSSLDERQLEHQYSDLQG